MEGKLQDRIAELRAKEGTMDKKYPSWTGMAANLAVSLQKVAAGALEGDDVLVSQQEFEDRLGVCAEEPCPCFDPGPIRCTACGCYLEIKARLFTMTCDLRRWPGDVNKPEEEDDDE